MMARRSDTRNNHPFSWRHALVLGAIGLLPAGAGAVTPYTPVVLPPGAYPTIGPGVIAPSSVFGKEYSHSFDTDIGGVVDPEQIIAWDGIGGTATGLDYSGSRGPQYPREQEVDATANHADAMFEDLKRDRAHLIFSHDDTVAMPAAAGPPVFVPGVVPSIGAVALTNGNVIGGAGELSVEESGFYTAAPPEVQHLWAPATSINDMPTPRDVDGVEVWGPEPGTMADADKYSLEPDAFTGGVSVWNYNLTTGSGSPYILHSAIVSAVEFLLGPVPTTAYNRVDGQGRDAINLDALMVQDVIDNGVADSDDTFDFDPTGGPKADEIIFSINQIVNPGDPSDPDGYYATGSELFVLKAGPAGALPMVSFLTHGGHTWDHKYTLGAMGIAGLGPNERAYIDINAIEVIGARVVPEPTALVLLGCVGVLGASRRRG